MRCRPCGLACCEPADSRPPRCPPLLPGYLICKVPDEDFIGHVGLLVPDKKDRLQFPGMPATRAARGRLPSEAVDTFDDSRASADPSVRGSGADHSDAPRESLQPRKGSLHPGRASLHPGVAPGVSRSWSAGVHFDTQIMGRMMGERCQASTNCVKNRHRPRRYCDDHGCPLCTREKSYGSPVCKDCLLEKAPQRHAFLHLRDRLADYRFHLWRERKLRSDPPWQGGETYSPPVDGDKRKPGEDGTQGGDGGGAKRAGVHPALLPKNQATAKAFHLWCVPLWSLVSVVCRCPSVTFPSHTFLHVAGSK